MPHYQQLHIAPYFTVNSHPPQQLHFGNFRRFLWVESIVPRGSEMVLAVMRNISVFDWLEVENIC